MLKLTIITLAITAGLGLNGSAAQAAHIELGSVTPRITAGVQGKHCGPGLYYTAKSDTCDYPDPSPPQWACYLPNGDRPTDCNLPGHTIPNCRGGHKTSNGTITSCL